MKVEVVADAWSCGGDFTTSSGSLLMCMLDAVGSKPMTVTDSPQSQLDLTLTGRTPLPAVPSLPSSHGRVPVVMQIRCTSHLLLGLLQPAHPSPRRHAVTTPSLYPTTHLTQLPPGVDSERLNPQTH